MEVAPYIAVAVVALLTVVGQVLFPSRTRRINRALAAQRRSRVLEARGPVRLTGRVRRSGELLRAPLSGRPCVAFELLVYRPISSSGRSGSNWCCLVEARQARRFMVADESGEAQVDTAGPFLLALVHDRTGETGWFGGYPGKHGELAAFLESTGYQSTNWLGVWKAFRYAEGVLEQGDLVSVGGPSAREVDPTSDRPDPRSPPERLVLRGTDALPLLISAARDACREP